jgi:hypothetical protein
MKSHAAAILLLTVLLAGCAPTPSAAPSSTLTPTAAAKPTVAATESPVPDPTKFQAMDPSLFFVDGVTPASWGGWNTKDINFHSPSRNIGCAILGPENQNLWGCVIIAKYWEFPKDSPSDYCYQSEIPCGGGIEVTGSGLPHPQQRGDLGYPGAGFPQSGETDPIRVLQYGQSVTFGNVTCYSEEIGVTCENNLSGHGFVIAKDRNDIY